jgi:hypothetical protein
MQAIHSAWAAISHIERKAMRVHPRHAEVLLACKRGKDLLNIASRYQKAGKRLDTRYYCECVVGEILITYRAYLPVQ